MAVVQISRIQVRRGRSLSGSGLPQLASGELAWSLDTQELYIGSGSVAEGAPAVGNTKILTERDLTVQGNLLNLIQHIYKVDDPAIQTGPTPNDPTSRQLQDRIDDSVSVADFGAQADGTTDDTLALQRAIDQLFLNSTTAASVDDADGTSTRVILDLGPGIYNTTSTLYIPSYATLVGAGQDKTIISYTGVGPAIQFVNDSSTIGSPSTIGNTTNNTQPRHIIIKGITIESNTGDQTCLQLDAVKESHFEDLIIRGNWNGVYNANSKGIAMHSVSALVTCQNNIFNRIIISGFSYAVYVKQDILNNKFIDGVVTDCRQGIVLGEGADGTTVGQQYGPRETQIVNFKFDNVKRHAVYIDRGTGNTTRDCKLTNVGNDGAGVYFPQYPQMYFGFPGNSSRNDQSDRDNELSTLSFTVDLQLNAPITANKGDLVAQATSLVQGTLKENYDSDSTITVVTKYVTPFNNFSNLTIAGNATPGDATQITITGSTTSAYITAGGTGNTTDGLAVGTAITFTGSMGGVVPGTTYYVKNVVDGVTFTISNTLGGLARALSVSSGSMFASFDSTIRPTLVGDLTLVPHLPMIAGFCTYESYSTKHVQLGYITSPALVCTLPVSTTASGTPARSISYLIKYMYRSNSNSFSRHGTITLVVDIDASVSTFTTKSQLTDDYIVTGISEENALLLDFSAVLLNETGSVFSGIGEIPSSIALRHTNTFAIGLSTDSGTFTYSYTVIQ
jgi:hypothetical protein